jgi:hypothetical protein
VALLGEDHAACISSLLPPASDTPKIDTIAGRSGPPGEAGMMIKADPITASAM